MQFRKAVRKSFRKGAALKISEPKALVLTGYGINCDYETQWACEKVGFVAQRVHLADLLMKRYWVSEYRLVVFPGGFSFGDDLGSGVAFASKIRFSLIHDGVRLYDMLMEYVHRGGLVLGICNGFQILVRLGMIPAINSLYGTQQVALAPNREGYYINRWVRLRVNDQSPSVFTKGLSALRLPARHGEGRFVAKERDILDRIEQNHHVCLRYCDDRDRPTQEFPFNPNGSEKSIAGVCDLSGRIFGLMPHPEAAMSLYQYPDWTRMKSTGSRGGRVANGIGDGYHIFKNAYTYGTG